MLTFRSPRSRSLAAITAALVIALAAGTADARAGRGSSSGSRGLRTYDAPAATSTAPRTAAPMERSMAPSPAPGQPGLQRPGAPMGSPAPAGGFFSRGLFGAIAGGLIGAGLAGLLFGHGLFGGMMGFGSIIGLLLQIALIVFLVRLALRFFRNRAAQPATAGGPMGYGRPDERPHEPMASPGPYGIGGGLGGGLGAGLGGGPAPGVRRERSDEIGIDAADYQAFERVLVGVQDAYGREDLNALRALATPEMVSYFAEDLAGNSSRGVVNRVSGTRLLSGDLAEAWREPGVEYATVALRFALIDVTVDRATGRVVEGDPDHPTEATELWTFRRPPGGQWQLSAIQQAG